MMEKIYAHPLRVYLLLLALAIAGVFAGMQLPVSLFPNSSKPIIDVIIPYSDSSATDFYRNYGVLLEPQLQSISTPDVQIDHFRAYYRKDSARYELEFTWGSQSKLAQQEINNVVGSFASLLPENSRNNYRVETNGQGNGGFMALSFYSDARDLDEVYDLVSPVLGPQVSLLPDVGQAEIFNPNKKEVRIELNPQAMAAFQIFPRDVENAIAESLVGRTAGSLSLGGKVLRIELPESTKSIQDLSHLQMTTKNGVLIHLSDIAQIDFATTTQNMIFKTSGVPSVILFALPKEGGNVKRMGEDIVGTVESKIKQLPPDIKYQVLINPADFINDAIKNVFHEVLLGAFLAVLVLFLVMGNLKNVITTAIEIPMSMVLAFLLMSVFHMNLNLISLGGLALASGMNVDASVVVMENIFRHREANPGELSFSERLSLIVRAVKEVRFSVISSTLASLIVFIPLTFTSAISYAILGDLAKAVVFSHGFSAIVALILVPTVRLQLSAFEKTKKQIAQAPLESFLKKIESVYIKSLDMFIAKKKFQYSFFSALVVFLILLLLVVLPRLPKEIVGLPDTDWLILNVGTTGNTIPRQLESQMSQIENQLRASLSDRISYTFTQIQNANSANIMIHLVSKKDMQDMWKKVQAMYPATPDVQYTVIPWNPSELNIPDPPDMRVVVQGGSIEKRAQVFQELNDLLQANQVFPNLWTYPYTSTIKTIQMQVNQSQMAALNKSNLVISDLSDVIKVATEGKQLSSSLKMGDQFVPIYLRYPDKTVASVDDIASFPIGVQGKIIPLKAVAPVSFNVDPPNLYREDGREVFLLLGKENIDSKTNASADLNRAKAIVQNWIKQNGDKFPGISVVFENAAFEIENAIGQLSFALCLSIALIFITLVMQFGTLIEPLIVMIAIPAGLIGVLCSLFLFHSSLSLNSVLGVILLNGIAVNNSIILVDFIKHKYKQDGFSVASALSGARARLRPILITSLATVLGMLPIAFGFGNGGKILQPLGIAVSGGLWVSMILTLFLVPAVYVSYLNFMERKKQNA